MKPNIIGPVSSLGYGQVTKYLIQELEEASLFPIGKPDAEPKFHDKIKKALNNAKMFDPNAPSVRIFHQFSLAEQVGSPKIGFPFFELDTFKPTEIHHINSCDYLFVASQWAKKVVVDQTSLSDNQVFVVPLGVDTDIFKAEENQDVDKTTFLNIGKIEIRKGHDILIDAFNKAFTKDDDVELHMMWTNPFLDEKQHKEWMRFYRDTELGSKVRFIPRVSTHEQVAEIITHCDVGVFPYKAEAWNLDLLEVMTCGKQVIATNYSGPTEYLNHKNSLLLEPTGMEPADDDIWFHGEGNWATYNIDDLVDLLRIAHKNKGVNHEGIKTGQRFTWKNSAATMMDILGELV